MIETLFKPWGYLVPEKDRRMGFIALLFVSVGGILGSGWLFGPLYAAQLAGPSALIAWVIGGFAIMVIALNFAELGAMLPLNGGITRYALLTYGRTVGFVASLSSWLTFTVIVAAEVQAVLQYLSIYFPWLTENATGAAGKVTTHPLSFPAGFLCAAALWILFSLINWRGIHFFARINNGLTWIKIGLVITVTVALFALSFSWEVFDDPKEGGFFPEGWSGIFQALAYGGVIYAFTGFQHAAIAAGESKNPHRDVPIAVLASIFFCLLCYLALQFAFLGGLREVTFSAPGDWTNLQFEDQVGPIAGLVKSLGVIWLFYLVLGGAIASPLGAGLINLGSSMRIAQGMSHDRYLPPRLSRTGQHGTPGLIIMLSFPIGLFLFLPFPGWQALVAFLTSVVVLAYAIGPLSVLALRDQLPDLKRPFRLWFASFFCPLAFVICGLLIFWTGWAIVWKLGLVFSVSGCLFMATNLLRRQPMDLRSASWLVPFLGGIVVITWLGSEHGNQRLTATQATLAVAAVSLVSFYVARKLAISPEETRQYFAQIEAARLEELEEQNPDDAAFLDVK